MPLRLPRPPADLVEAFEAERLRTNAVDEAIVAALMQHPAEAEAPPVRGPEKIWLLGAMPVEGLPRGSVLNLSFVDALRTRCWRFFLGLDDGSHAEIDFRGGQIVASRHVRVGEDYWLGLISRATLLWGRQTAGNNEARLLEFPWINIRAVRAVGPDPGVMLDETWPDGNHGMPMEEPDFIGYVLNRWDEKRAMQESASSESSSETAKGGEHQEQQ